MGEGQTLKRAPAREPDLHSGRPAAAHGKFTAGALDLGSSYGEEVAEDPSSAEKHMRVRQGMEEDDDYGSSDELDEEGELEEGELNSAQKRRLKRDLLMMGYDEDEDFEEVVAAQQHKQPAGMLQGNINELGNVLASQLTEEEQFAMSKKLFAQMRQELMGVPPPT